MMHRDLKSPNVLLSEEGVAKIADVGMVRSQVKELVTGERLQASCMLLRLGTVGKMWEHCPGFCSAKLWRGRGRGRWGRGI